MKVLKIYITVQGTTDIREIREKVNLIVPPVVNRLISVQELRAVAIKQLVKSSVSLIFFAIFF